MEIEYREFAGKAVVVTGGGGGIGLATAEAFAERGAAVLVVGRDPEKIAAAADGIQRRGSAASWFAGDVSREEDCLAFARRAEEEFGGIDFLFANAALMYPWGNLLTTSPEEWDRMLATNLRGAFLSARACVPSMIRRGGGVVIAVSSDCAVRACGHNVAYNASKHGVIGLIRSIAVDFGASGIRANVVVPGVDRDAWPSYGLLRAGTHTRERNGQSSSDQLPREGGPTSRSRRGLDFPVQQPRLVRHRCDDHGRRRNDGHIWR